jgi:SAM-dependent methyltransferase
MSTEFEATMKSAVEEFGAESATYDRNYDLTADRYPDHVFRLNIFKDLLASLRPTHILDAGCGSGIPLLTFLNDGFDAYGFDLSPEMVAQAKKHIQRGGHNESRVFQGDLDTFIRPIGEKFDAILGLGTVYYTPDTRATLRHLADNLVPNGHLIFSLRNELFSLFSLNRYSVEYLAERIYPTSKLSDELRRSLERFFQRRFDDVDIPRAFKNVDERRITSHLHNPLTVNSTLLEPLNLELVNIYYYHFHALPPIFEHTHTHEFRQLSASIENPTDWRGMFMASCFIVHARSNANK